MQTTAHQQYNHLENHRRSDKDNKTTHSHTPIMPHSIRMDSQAQRAKGTPKVFQQERYRSDKTANEENNQDRTECERRSDRTNTINSYTPVLPSSTRKDRQALRAK